MTKQSPALQVTDLDVTLQGANGLVTAVDGLSYQVQAGDTIALVGESGSGKTVSSLAVMGLLPDTAVVTGSVLLEGAELLGRRDSELRQLRGRELAMVFQDHGHALDPTMRIGKQIAEAVRLSHDVSRRAAKGRCLDLLQLLQLPRPERLLDAFPHQLSGGMRQRVLIALALAGPPRVLIADEPTTALDVSTEAHVMELLADLQAEFAMSIVLISHDRELAARYAHETVMLSSGQTPQQANTTEPMEANRGSSSTLPAVASVRSPRVPQTARKHAALLEVRDVVREHVVLASGSRRPLVVSAVSGVSFEIHQAETVSLIGESGAGKTSLAHAILQAPGPSSGEVLFRGVDLGALDPTQLRETRRHLQLISQSPFASMNPLWRIGAIVDEPLRAHRAGTRIERQRRSDDLLRLVGLDPSLYRHRRPHTLSGGQLQRVAIARAIALSPSLLVCDEPVSSLDPAAQTQIMSLLADLQARLGLSYLLIAHDLSLVQAVSHRIAVMYQGRLCEIGPADMIAAAPQHPYTASLLAADRIEASNQAPAGPPDTGLTTTNQDTRGCRFRHRCPRAQPLCSEVTPEMHDCGPRHTVACHFPPRDHAAEVADRQRPRSTDSPMAWRKQ